MTKSIVVTILLGLSVSLNAQTATKPKAPAAGTNKTGATPKPKTAASSAPGSIKTGTDSLSYALGLSLAQFYKQQGIKTVNTAMVSRGINDALRGGNTLMTEEQMNLCITN